jgi:hypothetical protein
MSLQELFDYLQEHRKCTLALPDVGAAHNLRVMLVKKWSREKISRDNLGFLSADARYLCISMEHGPVAVDGQSQEFTFHLRTRTRSKVEYTILTPASSDASDDSNP